MDKKERSVRMASHVGATDVGNISQAFTGGNFCDRAKLELDTFQEGCAMSRISRRSDNVEPPKSKIGMIVFVLGTLAAFIVLFPPWQSKEERQQNMAERVMKKVQEAEGDVVRQVERSRQIAGNSLSIKVITKDLEKFDALLTAYYSDVEALLSKLDANKEDSPVFAVNQAAGSAPVVVPDDVFAIVKWALEAAKQTDGYYDPTMRPFYELWRFDRDDPQIADPQVTESRQKLIGWSQVTLDSSVKTIFLPQKGMGLDLRMLQSGLILRELKSRLASGGFSDYFVFYGTDAIVSGKRLDGEAWKLSAQHPRKTLHYFALINPGDNAVMVANEYEIGFVRRGFYYHPYLDPHTGAPVQLTQSVAVVGPDPLLGDVLAFALFTRGYEDGLKMVTDAGYVAVLMNQAGESVASSGSDSIIVVEEGKNY
jgi:thiamine biosynthesis lipoprotein